MINPSEISDILNQQHVEDIAKRQVAVEDEGTVLEVGDLALQIAEKVIRKNIANDDAQRALVDQYLSEVEAKN